MSTVQRSGGQVEVTARLLNSFGLRVVEVTQADAEVAASVCPIDASMSLGDRLCLALGTRLGVAVATADRAWAHLEDGPQVLVIR